MALHGKIQVNGSDIAVWSARRLQARLDPQGTHLYEAEVVWTQGGSAARVLTHVYSDGATALAAKVLTWAATLAPPPPLIRTEGITRG